MTANPTAAHVATLLRSAGKRIVLAESCTGGLVAAMLAQNPGISEHLCGSAVVYRTTTKSAWLGIDPQLLEDPLIGPVSAQVTRALALAVLQQTPEADLAAAVTGHHGPNAPPELDGLVHVAVAIRDAQAKIVSESGQVLPALQGDPAASRIARQTAAAELVLTAIAATLGG
jgi:PncC family amidohydrolase